MTSLVSICIPTYNGAKYLRECIDSVLSQSFENFQVVIVDDQSSDNTWEILERYAAQDHRINLFKNEHNLGLVGNWNRCIELAQGEWIKFVFQDDLLAPDCVAQLVIAGETTDCSIVFCKRELIFEPNCNIDILNFLQDLPSWESVFGDVTFISPNRVCETAIKYMVLNVFGEPTSVLLRRDCFIRFGLFNPHFKQRCDYEYWLRIGSQTGIVLVPKILASFRLHPESTTSSNNANKHYITEIGDHLLLLYEYAYSDAFSVLRFRASNQIPTVNFINKLNEYIGWAFRMLYEKESQGLIESQMIIKMIFENLSAYPKLVSLIRSKKRFLPIFMWLDRQLLWRIK
jgi:glycosyltransferase involved in cell wall biosynthesis